MQKTRLTAYEQPLNERIRAMLRLEYLFDRASYRIEGASAWDSRASLEAVLDILALLTRADLKAEIIKELERHAATLEALRNNRGVDLERLDGILEEVRRPLLSLRAVDSVPGSELRQNELLSAVRQRSSIPAGTCSFDVPAYQFWLERPAEERVSQLEAWLGAFDLVREAITLSLRLIRQSARPSHEVAPAGPPEPRGGTGGLFPAQHRSRRALSDDPGVDPGLGALVPRDQRRSTPVHRAFPDQQRPGGAAGPGRRRRGIRAAVLRDVTAARPTGQADERIPLRL